MRVKSMERTRQTLEKLQVRIAAGKLKQPEKIGALPSGCCSGAMVIATIPGSSTRGASGIRERGRPGEREGDEGRYVIATSELGLSVVEVVAITRI